MTNGGAPAGGQVLADGSGSNTGGATMVNKSANEQQTQDIMREKGMNVEGDE